MRAQDSKSPYFLVTLVAAAKIFPVRRELKDVG